MQFRKLFIPDKKYSISELLNDIGREATIIIDDQYRTWRIERVINEDGGSIFMGGNNVPIKSNHYIINGKEN